MDVEQSEEPSGAFPNRAGTIRWHMWPPDGAPRYWVGYGSLDTSPPTWGLVIMQGTEVEEAVKWVPRPRDVTTAALRAWLETRIGADAANGIVDACQRKHPELFVAGS
ncbi:MAG TPA: hypothetical protein VNF24_07760 [Candidatus Acidoferrales bacterium]|nr:hypothetical protein [Candidatus Micrarchaeaceae archaeon]HVB54071.1 hypothetical protein [Candidatus Acidoferrales bacterium]